MYGTQDLVMHLLKIITLFIFFFLKVPAFLWSTFSLLAAFLTIYSFSMNHAVSAVAPICSITALEKFWPCSSLTHYKGPSVDSKQSQIFSSKTKPMSLANVRATADDFIGLVESGEFHNGPELSEHMHYLGSNSKEAMKSYAILRGKMHRSLTL